MRIRPDTFRLWLAMFGTILVTWPAGAQSPPAPAVLLHPGQSPPGPEGWPTSTTTGPYDGHMSGNLRGQCATLCTSGLAASGGITTSNDGQAIECKAITGGGISIKHKNVTVKCVTIDNPYKLCTGTKPGIRIDAAGAVVEDTTVYGGTGNTGKGVRSISDVFTLRRVDISRFTDGVVDKGYEIYDSYLHGLWTGGQGNTCRPHNDNMQMTASKGRTVLDGNNVVHINATQTSNFIFLSTFGKINDITITNNRFERDQAVNGYLKDKGVGHGSPTNITFENNTFVGNKVLQTSCADTWTWINNVFEDTGQQIGNPCR